ncbi:hypothetical protein FHG66_16430 [Rubellimicrobium rubrum]|uniref:Transposase DDE domain-containing protein n=1 Tax=Rubellimicrobium rubrum TaxID=2585369 RepID=A0A5C4MNQ9_9RHOB|nr:hypothetical protein FHG66_16430 [Rubellimicrobium rubrum]
MADLPPATRLLGNKSYDADWLRDELKARGLRGGLRVCIPAQSKRNCPATHNRKLTKTRCRIENAVVSLTDWRALAMRSTRCRDLFLSAVALATAVIFRLRSWAPIVGHTSYIRHRYS